MSRADVDDNDFMLQSMVQSLSDDQKKSKQPGVGPKNP